jgi:hypothetical protein
MWESKNFQKKIFFLPGVRGMLVFGINGLTTDWLLGDFSILFYLIGKNACFFYLCRKINQCHETEREKIDPVCPGRMGAQEWRAPRPPDLSEYHFQI